MEKQTKHNNVVLGFCDKVFVPRRGNGVEPSPMSIAPLTKHLKKHRTKPEKGKQINNSPQAICREGKKKNTLSNIQQQKIPCLNRENIKKGKNNNRNKKLQTKCNPTSSITRGKKSF